MNQLILKSRQPSPRKAWMKAQSKTSHHRIAVLLYAMICAAAILKPTLAFWGPFIFFIITALTKMEGILCSMLFSLVITTIASLIHPILGLVVSVIFLLMKISNLIQNWRGLLAGIFIYLLPSFMVRRLGYFLIYGTPLHKMLFSLNLSVNFTDLLIVCIIGFCSGLILHLTLNWLYSHHYSVRSALSTMGAAPLIILLALLPFIIQAVGELIDDVMSCAGSSIYDDFLSFRDEFETVDLDGDGINDSVHHVRGHYRSMPDGGFTYVDPHIRTNPNGIVSDNISYHR